MEMFQTERKYGVGTFWNGWFWMEIPLFCLQCHLAFILQWSYCFHYWFFPTCFKYLLICSCFAFFPFSLNWWHRTFQTITPNSISFIWSFHSFDVFQFTLILKFNVNMEFSNTSQHTICPYGDSKLIIA